MYQLNSKIKGLEPYEPLEGDFKIRLDANESFLPLSQDALNVLTQAIASIPFQRYPDPMAKGVCKAFAEYYEIDANLVTAGNGSDELISVLVNSFLTKGDTVLTLSPDFSMYRFYSSLAEAQCLELKKGGNLRIDVEELIKVANESNAKMILFSNPCNPTSLGLQREQVRKLIQSVSALVVLDEAYMDFWDQSLLKEVEEYDNLIILRTCSKALGLAAVRLGFAVASTRLTKVIRAVKSPYNVNAVTQKIAEIILSNHQLARSSISQVIAAKEELMKMMQQLLQKHPEQFELYPSCTNFVLVRLPNAPLVYKQLLSYGIAVRLVGDCLRITAGNFKENHEFIAALEKIIEGGRAR